MSIREVCYYCEEECKPLTSNGPSLHDSCRESYEISLKLESDTLKLMEDLYDFTVTVIDSTINPDELDECTIAQKDCLTGFITSLTLCSDQFDGDEQVKLLPANHRLFKLFSNFTRIKTIWVEQFGELGLINANLSKLTHLESIHLFDTWLRPGKLIFPASLKYFSYHNYRAPYFPCELIFLLNDGLEELSIRSFVLNHIPEGVLYKRNLKILEMRGHVKSIPENICELQKLSYLRLRDNDIETLPESLKIMRNLRKINLCFNKIKDIALLEMMTWLDEIQIKGNRITTIPRSLQGKIVFKPFE